AHCTSRPHALSSPSAPSLARSLTAMTTGGTSVPSGIRNQSKAGWRRFLVPPEAGAESGGELRHAGNRRNPAGSGDRSPRERAGEQALERRHGLDEQIPIPERRPRGHDQDDAALEKVGGEEDARQKGDG